MSLAKITDTSDEWIVKRTGMKKRFHVSDGEGLTSLALTAAGSAMDRSGIDPEEIGAVIVSTFTADYYTPSAACLIQKELQLREDILAFDLNAACSGFLFGLETMRALLMSSGEKYGLLIGADVMTSKLDMTDRGTCVLFGDGAAAAVISTDENKLYKFLPGVKGNEKVISAVVPDGKLKMDGAATYRFAVSTVPEAAAKVINAAGITVDDIDHYILHQANLRIIEAIAKRLDQPMDKFFVNIHEYGNTSAASVALALTDCWEKGLLKEGDKILLSAFGAGLTYSAAVLEW